MFYKIIHFSMQFSAVVNRTEILNRSRRSLVSIPSLQRVYRPTPFMWLGQKHPAYAWPFNIYSEQDMS